MTEEKDKIDNFFYSYASPAIPEWREPNVLFFKLKSNIAQGAFSNNKNHFVPYIQKRVTADNLIFDCEVELDPTLLQSSKEGSSFIERLNELKNTNPAVDVLIDRLKLDFFKNE